MTKPTNLDFDLPVPELDLSGLGCDVRAIFYFNKKGDIRRKTAECHPLARSAKGDPASWSVWPRSAGVRMLRPSSCVGHGRV
jgi:hypothetical protein